MRDAVERLWPELAWIEDADLRDRVTETWVRALDRSPLEPDDLERIPFTLLVPDCPVTFMEHKRCVVHIARQGAEAMREFMGHSLDIDQDTVIAGAILADVGKVLEYEEADGEVRQSARGKALRHPFTGVAVAISGPRPSASSRSGSERRKPWRLTAARRASAVSQRYPPVRVCVNRYPNETAGR